MSAKGSNVIPKKIAIMVILLGILSWMFMAGIILFLIYGGTNQATNQANELNEISDTNKVENNLTERNSANPKIPKYINLVMKKEDWIKLPLPELTMYVKREEGYIYIFTHEGEIIDSKTGETKLVSTGEGVCVNIFGTEDNLFKVSQSNFIKFIPLEKDYYVPINTEFYEVKDLGVNMYSLYKKNTNDQFYITDGDLLYYNIGIKLPLEYKP